MGEKIAIYVLLFVTILFLWLMIWVGVSHSIEIETNSFDPPKGSCKQGEVYRCIMGTCLSTLLSCPPVYEDGRLIYNNCNKTTCSWNCECIKKELKETNQEWRQSIEDISEAITIDVLQIVTD